MTYPDIFQKIKNAKDKYVISNLLDGLIIIEPNPEFIEELVLLSQNRNSNIKWSALGLLSNFNHPSLEKFFLDIIRNSNDNLTVGKAISGLRLNGSEESINELITIFKKSRDSYVRGVVISTLFCIYLRNELTSFSRKIVFEFIGNEYPYFQGYWNNLKNSEKVDKTRLFELSSVQIKKNFLNVVYEYSDKIDIHIFVERKSKSFIRSVNAYCIYKGLKQSYSKHYTPIEFSLSESMVFDTIFEKSSEMRLDQKEDAIISLYETEILPKLYNKIEVFKDLETMSFLYFERQETEICSLLYGSNNDFVVAHMMTNSIVFFEKNPDKDKFIDFLIEKWKETQKVNFSIISYLQERKNPTIINI